MTIRQSTASRPVFSASAVLDAVAAELSTIKHEDNLTDADLGRVLGKSEDQAAKYRTGLAEMGIVAFAAAKREWNGRFTGALDRLCAESRPIASDDRPILTALFDLGSRLSKALEDGEIKPSEVRDSRAQLEGFRDMIDEQLRKLGPGSAAA
jgi:hypothetical protein